MPRSGNKVLLSQNSRKEMFKLSTEYWGGHHTRFSAVVQLESAFAQILITITVCRGHIPQVFFVLHPAEALNHSLKGAKLAITLNSRSFVYIHMHAQSQNDVL